MIPDSERICSSRLKIGLPFGNLHRAHRGFPETGLPISTSTLRYDTGIKKLRKNWPSRKPITRRS